MKYSVLKIVVFTITFLSVFGYNKCYAQDVYIIKHTQSNDRGSFSVTQQGSAVSKKKIKVNEISLSVSGKTSRTVMVTADIRVESAPEIPKGIKAVIRSYADPDFKREVEYKESDDNSGVYEENIKDIKEDSVPVKLYLEVTVNGEISTYYFWDENDLSSIVSDINNEYGSNLEVVGEGRSVSVRNANFKKVIDDKTVSKRFYATKEQIDQSGMKAVFGFDITDLEKKLVSDKIMSKDYIGNFTLIIDPSDMYVNGNKIPDSLLPEYRKIMNGFSFDFEDN